MKISLSFFLILIELVGFTQTDSSLVRNVTESSFIDYSDDLKLNHMDTVLSKFYYYGLDGRVNITSLGNQGLAFGSMIFNTPKYGFNTGGNSFTDNYPEFNRTMVYQTNIPFARVSYTSGSKEYRNFDVFFTENINPRFNLAIGFKTFGSTGFYVNQSTNGRRFNFQNSFKSKKNKYGYYLKYSVVSGTATENGGISSDSVYNSLVQLSPFNPDNNKLKVVVWHENAMNYYDKRLLNIAQYYRIGKSDSSASRNSGAFMVMNNDVFLDKNWYDDKLPDSVYYSNFGIHIDSNESLYDSYHNFGLKNKLFFKYSILESRAIFRTGVNSSFYKNTNLIEETFIDETNLFASISNFQLSLIDLSVSYTKGISGFNSKGYRGDVNINSRLFSNQLKIDLNLLFNSSLPSYKQLRYQGTHVMWENDFNYVFTNEYLLAFNLDSIGLSLSSKLTRVNNYVYYDSSTMPRQFDDSFNAYFITLNKHLVLGSYHFDFSVIYQETTNNAPVNVPSWIGKVSVYYQRFLFGNAMELRYGIDYWQNSKYTADFYAPFTRSFVYQNEYEVGDFPYMNFYISGRIKGAQGFVNFQNIGQILFRENYMMVPYYPLQDFGMLFGLRWDFFN